MIIIGWGKNVKEIGYYGIEKCPHCRNYVDFDVCELSNNVKLYFFTVAKFNKKRYLRCGACGCGYELDESQYGDVSTGLSERFDKVTTNEIWNLFGEKISLIEGQIGVEDIEKIKAELIDKYKKVGNVSEIINTYLQCMIDDDKAR